MENKAFNQVYNDILSKVLQLSEDPSQFADYLTQQIRELIGARTIVIAVKAESEPTKIFSVFPRRRTEWANQDEVLQLAELSGDFEKIQYLGQETSGEAIALLLKTLEIDKAIVIPLIAANRKVGSILLLDILDEFGIESVIDLLTRLSGVFALVIRNSILYQNMENLVATRTNELRKKNNDLEEALVQAEKSEMRTRDILQTAMDGFWVADLKGKFIEVNDVACKKVGYTRKEMLKLGIFDLEIVETAEQTQKHIQKIFEIGEDRFETKHRCKNGQIIDVELSVKFQSNQNLFVVFVHDITERKKAEKKIRDSEAKFRAYIERAPVAVFVTNLEGQFLEINPAITSLLDYDVATLKKMSIQNIVSEDDRDAIQRALENLRQSGYAEGEFQLKRIDGTSVWVLLNINLIGGSIALGYCRNITERKRAEEVLAKNKVSLQEALEVSNRARQSLLSVLEDQRAAEREIQKLNAELEQRVLQRTAQLEEVNKELESFSYSVSHDLRAPLRHISGFADMLANDTNDQLSSKAQHYLHTIKDSARKMGILIDDLLSFSRTGRTEMRKTSIGMNQVVKDAIKQVEISTKDRNIEWEIANLPAAYGDYNLLLLVWINLVDNAVKYTRKREKAIIQIDCHKEKDEYIFRICDNGAGFDMKYAQKLFGVFQRLHSSTEFEGTGIGLANVRRIILRHGGRTWAEAEPDKGATFYFTLPC